MSQRVVTRPRADRDLEEHAEYLAGKSIQAARRFYEAADKAFQALAGMPGMGGLWEPTGPEFTGIRVWPIQGFEKHLVFYRVRGDGVEVVRAFHGSQDLEAIFGSQE